MSEFLVPGYEVLEMIGFGGSAEVWLGRDVVSGELVALKRLRHPGDPETAERLRREAAALAVVTHPHVVRLRAVVDAENETVLVLDHAAGGSLATLLAARGRLTAGEVVTLAVPLAQALSALSAQGVVHGDISPGNILFDGSGRPLLGDFGVVQILGTTRDNVEATAEFLDPAVLRGGIPTAASDVYALGAVCLTSLFGTGAARAAEDAFGAEPPPQLLDVLRRATARDPVDRPTAAAFASEVFDTCPPVPIHRVDPAGDDALRARLLTHRVQPVPAPSEAASVLPRRPWRRAEHRLTAERLAAGRRSVAGITSLVIVIVLAGAAGMLWARSVPAGPAATIKARTAPTSGSVATAPSTTRSRTPAADADAWMATLRRLDVMRSRAFARADPEALEDIYSRGAPALRRDRRLLAQLVASGTTARGLRLNIKSARPVRVAEHRALLKVVDVMSPYDLVTHEGRLVERRRGRPAATWLVTLVREGSGWRVFEVAHA